MNKIELIGVDDLFEGMILGEDIQGKYDLLILSKGKVLSEQNISVLKNQGLDYVYIEVPSKEDAFKSSYSELENELKEVFSTNGQLSRTAKEKIQGTLNNLLEALPQRTNMLMELKRLKMKDEYSVRHSLNVALLSGLMGVWLQIPDEDVQELMLSGAMHDIGKVFVSQDILSIPGKLNRAQFEEVQKHTSYGYKKLSHVDGLPESIARVALEHHERLDGSGYPGKHTEEKLHFYTKIVMIVDIFDASTANKVYGSRIQPLQAIRELEHLKNQMKIDSTLFNVFIRNIYKLFVGCNVVLENGVEGEIAFFHKLSPDRPIIRTGGKLMNLAHHPTIAIKDIY